MKIALVHNFATHYSEPVHARLSQIYDTDIYYFSEGGEWYWQKQHGVRKGSYRHEYLAGFYIGKTRIVPSLPYKLLLKSYDIYIKCINGRFALLATFLITRIKRKPFILYTGIWTRLTSRFHRVFFPIVKYIYRQSDAIVVYGNHVKKYLEREGIVPEKIFVAPHAVDNSQYNRMYSDAEKNEIKKRLNISAGDKVVLFLGRAEKIKGLEYLVDAISELGDPSIKLILAGDGAELMEIKNRARERKVHDQTRFPGYIFSDKAPLYYSIADVFVLPSISLDSGKELWGLVINEAFNQGVPVIATEAVGAAAGDLVQNGINGYIVPEANSQALARALRDILEFNDRRKEMSMNAKRTIEFWNIDNMIKGYQNAIQYVLDRR